MRSWKRAILSLSRDVEPLRWLTFGGLACGRGSRLFLSSCEYPVDSCAQALAGYTQLFGKIANRWHGSHFQRVPHDLCLCSSHAVIIGADIANVNTRAQLFAKNIFENF